MGGICSSIKKQPKNLALTQPNKIIFLEGVSALGKSGSIERCKDISKKRLICKLYLDIIEISDQYKLTISENLNFDRILYNDLYKTLLYKHLLKHDRSTNQITLIDRSPVAVYIYDMLRQTNIIVSNS